MKSYIKKHKKTTVFIAVLTVFIYAFGIYVSDFCKADETAITALEDAVSFDGNYCFIPEKPKAGFIFYPGGKVECEAYAPLMKSIAGKGYLCVIARMPFNLAFFKMNVADSIMEAFPDIDEWYIGGHSLGGVAAASYAEKNSEKLDGLVFLAAFTTENFTDNDIDIISIYGTEDAVLNKKSYDKCFSNLPSDTEEFIIEGANHSQFGSYGLQKGDSEANITADEQWKTVADTLERFFAE